MAQIPPKSFFKLTKDEQVSEAVRRMNIAYQVAEEWKKISVQCRQQQLIEPEIDRPDVLELKG